MPGSLIDPHGLGSALVGKHLLLTCPASAGLFLRRVGVPTQQPTASRAVEGVGEPTGALRVRQVGNPGGGRKSLAFLAGLRLLGPSAGRSRGLTSIEMQAPLGTRDRP